MLDVQLEHILVQFLRVSQLRCNDPPSRTIKFVETISEFHLRNTASASKRRSCAIKCGKDLAVVGGDLHSSISINTETARSPLGSSLTTKPSHTIASNGGRHHLASVHCSTIVWAVRRDDLSMVGDASVDHCRFQFHHRVGGGIHHSYHAAGLWRHHLRSAERKNPQFGNWAIIFSKP